MSGIGVLQEQLRRFAEKEDSSIFGAVSPEGEIVAAALFTQSPADENERLLLHVYVKPKWRGQGMAGRLLQYAQQYFRELGVHSLRVKCCGSVDGLEDTYDFLTGIGFAPLVLQGHLFRYRLSDCLNSRFAEQFGLSENEQENVRVIESWDDALLQSFIQEENGMVLSKDGVDLQFSRFYVSEGRIQGALCAERLGENLLFLHKIYMTSDVSPQKAIPPMLAAFLTGAGKAMPEDAILMIQSELYASYHGICGLFGVPDEEYFIQEYAAAIGETVQESSGQKQSDLSRKQPWQWKKLDKTEAVDSFPGGEIGLPPVSELDDAAVRCMNADSYWIPGMTLQIRRKRERLEKKPTEHHRTELNAWLELLGRETLSPQKALSFAGLLLERKPVSETDLPDTDTMSEVEQESIVIQPDGLDFFLFSEKPESFAAVLPEYLQTRCLQGELILIGAKKEPEEVLAYAAFTRQAAPKATVMLEYLLVGEQYRRQGIGRRLLEFAQDVLHRAGVRGISAKTAGTVQQLAGTHDFLKKAGFRPVTMSGRIALYYLQDLYDTTMMNLTEGQLARLPEVQEISDRNDYRLKSFMQRSAQKGFSFDRNRFDSRFTRFYTEGGEIRGVVSMERTADHVLFLRDYYMEKGYGTPFVQAALLESALHEARLCMGDDTILVLQIYRGWSWDMIHTLLGQGETQLHLHEYIMPVKEMDAAEGKVE